ncbi:MAG: COX15/CtaA family protein [Acidimicrobiales bacterium]
MVATYCLVVLGSTVRVTNSGMGCRGWPLCSGQVGPIAQFHPFLEQSHRYLVTLVTVLILVLAALVWRIGPKARHVRGPALVCVGVIAVQIVLGSITVITNNAPVTVALHLAVGLVFLGVVTTTAVASFIVPAQSRSLLHEPNRLAWVAVAGLFFVLISGSLVVDGGAQSACKSWPACFGSRASGGLVALQLAHRSMVLIGGALVVVYLAALLRKGSVNHAQRLFAVSGLVLLTIQVAVGAFDALLGSPAALADVHLALASALWALVVAVVALSAKSSKDRTALVGCRDVERTVLATAGREDC